MSEQTLRSGKIQSYPLIHTAQQLGPFDFRRKIRYTLRTRDLGERITNHTNSWSDALRYEGIERMCEDVL